MKYKDIKKYVVNLEEFICGNFFRRVKVVSIKIKHFYSREEDGDVVVNEAEDVIAEIEKEGIGMVYSAESLSRKSLEEYFWKNYKGDIKWMRLGIDDIKVEILG